VKLIFDAIHLQAVKNALGYYPSVDRFMPYFTPKSLTVKFESHAEMTREKALRRKESKDRADFISNLIKPENHISDVELFGNCGILIIAGSETTATVLSSAIYFLLKNPDVMSKLVSETQSSLKDISEINFLTISKQKYILACLNETLRPFPPVPGGLSRVVPGDGGLIDGKWVTGGVS
jgi:cytochrome P450